MSISRARWVIKNKMGKISATLDCMLHLWALGIRQRARSRSHLNFIFVVQIGRDLFRRLDFENNHD